MKRLGMKQCPLCVGTGKVYDAEVTGEAMRTLREVGGVSLRQMAKRLGVSPAYLSKMETGQLKWPNKRVAEYVSLLLDVKPKGKEAR